jgi:spermidine/putrescine transport system substrate-binding protein
VNTHDRLELERLLRVAASRPMSRRGFLAALGASGVVAACGTGVPSPSASSSGSPAGSASSGPASEAPSASASAGGVVHDQVESEFNLYNWVDYDAPETISGFEDEYSTTIIYDVFTSNEEALAKFQAGGGSGYDMLAPTGYILPSFIAGNFIRKIDRSRLGNYANIDPKFLNLPFDPQSEYYIPKDWGTTGFMYRSSDVSEEPKGWTELYALGEKYSGKIGILDDKPVNIGAALKSLGYPINSVDPAQLEEAAEVLYAFAPHVGNVSNDYRDILETKDMLIHQGWNGDAATLKARPGAEDTVYVVPEEGTEFWVDAWVIPTDAAHPNAAYAWLDYVLRPEIAVQETSYTLYGCAVQAAYPLLPDEIRSDPTVFPPDELIAKLEPFVDNEANAQRNDIWATFRSRIGA